MLDHEKNIWEKHVFGKDFSYESGNIELSVSVKRWAHGSPEYTITTGGGRFILGKIASSPEWSLNLRMSSDFAVNNYGDFRCCGEIFPCSMKFLNIETESDDIFLEFLRDGVETIKNQLKYFSEAPFVSPFLPQELANRIFSFIRVCELEFPKPNPSILYWLARVLWFGGK